ncbi:MAG: class I SAM-dependent methyltransferase [Flavobacteriaceae bacterium]|nr:class I SAM-dependent methyltransferase [Flavobacteriaceae bacterium]
MDRKKEWFQHWFDTDYYHLLYDNRDEKEAEFFMKNLIQFLDIKKGDKILDLPCGKGRHALFLNAQGYDVVGADLSKNSIKFAKTFENSSLKFTEHDMRNPLEGRYDAIFNLFTSFGYFDQNRTNIKVLTNFKNALKKNGSVIIDFLNIEKVVNNLIPEEIFLKNGINFHISRSVKDGFLIKNIMFHADDEDHHFIEKVQCLSLQDIKGFSDIANLKIKHIFGDYILSSFDKKNSDRLILILQ